MCLLKACPSSQPSLSESQTFLDAVLHNAVLNTFSSPYRQRLNEHSNISVIEFGQGLSNPIVVIFTKAIISEYVMSSNFNLNYFIMCTLPKARELNHIHSLHPPGPQIDIMKLIYYQALYRTSWSNFETMVLTTWNWMQRNN